MRARQCCVMLLAALLPGSTLAMEFGTYIMLQQGMTEAELIDRAGPPDYAYPEGVTSGGFTWQPHGDHGRAGIAIGGSFQQEAKADVYTPTPGTPYLTVVHIVGGRIVSIERIPRF